MLKNDDIPPEFRSNREILAIDFDGVIHNSNCGYLDGTCYGEPIDGSLESIKLLSNKYTLVIFTAKAKSDRPLVNGKTGVELVWDWLNKYGIGCYIFDVTSDKPRAKYYIDDNAIRFETWDSTMNFLGEGK